MEKLIPKINIFQNQQEIGQRISSGSDEYVQSHRSFRERYVLTGLYKEPQIAWLLAYYDGHWITMHMYTARSQGDRHLWREYALTDGKMPNQKEEKKKKTDMKEQRHDNRSPLISLMGSWLESRSTKTGNSSSYRQHQ